MSSATPAPERSPGLRPRTAPFAVRNLVLIGAPAQRWARSRGWESAPVIGLRVFGDVLATEEWAVSRLWLGPGTHERRVQPSEHGVVVVLLAEGQATMTMQGCANELQAGSVFIAGPDAAARLTTTTGVALYEVVGDPNRIGLPLLGLDHTAGPFPSTADVWMALSSLLNHLLGSTLEPAGVSIRALGRGIESLVLATLQSAGLVAEREDRSERTLLALAKGIVAEHASNPGFSVIRLAQLSRISRGHLYRLFAEDGTTPRAEIMSVRARNAEAQIEHIDASDELALARVARACGFRTVAAMRRAVADELAGAHDARAGAREDARRRPQ